jgi:hypothetical protein
MDTSSFDEANIREYAVRLVDIALYRQNAYEQNRVYIEHLYGYYNPDTIWDLYSGLEYAIF